MPHRYTVHATDEQGIRWGDTARALACRNVQQYLARAADLVASYHRKMLQRAWRKEERLERARREGAK